LKGTLRQSLGWLHTWGGLACGWLLCAIFLSGSLSVFRQPITRWMEAQPPPGEMLANAPGSGHAVDRAQAYLHDHAAATRAWRVQLPRYPGEALRLTWRGTAGSGEVALAADTGAPLPVGQIRRTEGGRHFMSFHYMLQLPVLGFWLVGWLTLGLLVALLSGVVVHRRLFKDFFTIRPGRGPRAWLDAHSVGGVLSLPFLLMIGFTGLGIFATSYMPAPLRAVYGTDAHAYARFEADRASHPASLPPAPITLESRAAAPPWSILLQRAEALTGQAADALSLDDPGAPGGVVRISGRAAIGPSSTALLNPAASVSFDAATGEVRQVRLPLADALSAGERLQGVVESLHVAGFGGWPMKWLYFASGLLGASMMAAGTLLFSIKRRIKSQHEFGLGSAGFYRCVDACNVASVIGIGVACIGYFYVNRLLPAALESRSLWEVRGFLLIWLATLVHALCRPVARAWREQLGLAALLCFGLPLLNLLSTGQHLGRYLAVGDWQRASVEGVAWAFGLLLLFALRQARGMQAARRPACPRASAAGSGRVRWGIASRVLAATVGGYGVSAGAMALAALLWVRLAGGSAALAVAVSTLSSFVLYSLAVLWAFAPRRASTVWLGMGAALAVLGLAVLALGGE
jgi:uncharacterized iron-regulated membrane protein